MTDDEIPTGTGYMMAYRTAHVSAWGSGHTHSGPVHDGPCVCECGVVQPFDVKVPPEG